MLKIVLASALALLASCAPPPQDNGARIDALLRAYTGAVPGASVLVLRDGAPVFRRAYGLADLEAHVAGDQLSPRLHDQAVHRSGHPHPGR